MSILEIFIYVLVLCCFFNITIITFPEAYKKTIMQKKINMLLILSAVIYCVVLIVFIIINYYCQIPQVEFNTSLLMIPFLTIIIFIANIYYPAMRMFVVANKNKYSIAEGLYGIIINYRFGSTEERKETIKSLESFLQNHQNELKNSSEMVLLQKLIEQSTTSTIKAPEKLIDLSENACINMMNEANQSGNPFSHVCLISSYSLSSLLTILIAFISL